MPLYDRDWIFLLWKRLFPLSSSAEFSNIVTTKKVFFIDYLRALSYVFQERINLSAVLFLSLKLLKIEVNKS